MSPDSRIVAFSAVIEDRPDWAEGAVRKDEVDRLIEVLDELRAPVEGPRGEPPAPP